MTAPTHAERELLVVDSPYEVANWRPLVHWLLFIPHGAILYVMRALAGVVFVVYWFVFVFTGRLNPGLYGVMAMYERYSQRAGGFLLGYSERYPPFDFALGPSDNEAYPPIRLDLPEPRDPESKKAAFNWLLAIPHYVVVAVYGIAAAVVAVIGWFAVLFTGRWPASLRDFLVRVANYYLRVWTYVTMVTAGYPRFSL